LAHLGSLGILGLVDFRYPNQLLFGNLDIYLGEQLFSPFSENIGAADLLISFLEIFDRLLGSGL
jgi:hypothetical protein